MKLMQEFFYEQEGFCPVMFEKTWQIAILNYMKEQHIDGINKVDIHYETDEAFVLLKGDACLIAAEKRDEKQLAIHNTSIALWEVKKMLPNIVYNIPAHCWHNIAMKEGSSVLIIEKNGTHNGDFEFHYLTEKDKKNVHSLVCNNM